MLFEPARSAEPPTSCGSRITSWRTANKFSSKSVCPNFELLLGEVDYGLTSSFVHDNGQVKIKVGCYDLSYYKGLDKDFMLPDGIVADDDGFPVVPMQGFIKTENFPIS